MIAIGDKVLVCSGATKLAGVVFDFESWRWILAQTEDGRLWLEVVMNISAVDWTQLVLLEADVSASDRQRIMAIGEAIAYRPKRTDVEDVPGAALFCAQHDQIKMVKA